MGLYSSVYGDEVHVHHTTYVLVFLIMKRSEVSMNFT